MERVRWVALFAIGFGFLGGSCGGPPAASKSSTGGGSSSGGSVSGGGAGGGSSVAGNAALGGSANQSGGSSAMGGAATTVRAVDDFNHAFWQAFCEGLFRCTLISDDDIGIKAMLGSEQRCADIIRQVQSRDARFLDLQAKLASGAIRFVADKAAACLAETKSCDYRNRRRNLVKLGPACRAVFEGSVALGGACRRYEECQGDARCDLSSTCPGKCVERVAPGESCSEANDCDDTTALTECRFNTNAATGSCATIAVAGPAAEGQVCKTGPIEAGIAAPCANGLWCDVAPNDTSQTGICRRPIPADGACDDADDLCVDGTTCFDQVSCKPFPFSTRAGDPCDSENGPYCDPFSRLSCVAGKCQTLGDGSVGSGCSTSDIHEIFDCQPGLQCAQGDTNSSSVCKPFVVAGVACAVDSECLSGTCSDGKCASEFCDN